MFLLDTNAVSEPIRQTPDKTFMKHFSEHRTSLVISSVTWHELLFGWEQLPEGKRKNAIRAYLFDVVAPSIPVLPYEQTAAEWHARERARLQRRGRPAAFADGQIAATAATRHLTLVTRNLRDFTSFSSLTVESWWGAAPKKA